MKCSAAVMKYKQDFYFVESSVLKIEWNTDEKNS